MKLFSQGLFFLVSLSFLQGCDQADVTEKNIAEADVVKAPVLVGAALYNSDKAPDSHLYDLPTKVVDDPMTAVVRGTGIVLEDISALKEVLISIQHDFFDREFFKKTIFY